MKTIIHHGTHQIGGSCLEFRDFLAMCECRTEGERTPNRATVVWLEWAYKYANEIDPFEDSFLTRVVKSFSSERIS